MKQKERKEINYSKAKGLLSRMKGLMGQKIFLPFLIKNCSSIHTFGMKVPLDLIWLNQDFEILKIDPNIPPRRIKYFLKASHILECPQGFCKKNNLKAGDLLNLEEKKIIKNEKIKFLEKNKNLIEDESGQALVEAAFILPILMTIVFGFIQLGIAIHELQKLTYVANFATQTGSLSNNNLKVTGSVQQYYPSGEVTVNIESRKNQTQNIISHASRRHEDIITVELKKDFNLKIPFISVNILPLTAKASARILCTENNPPYTCL